MPGGPKLIHITFNMDEGPKVKIRKIEFTGNKAISDGTLKQQLKENKEQGPFTDFIHFPTWFLSLIGDHGTYQEQKFDEDAEKVVAYYRDHGYLRANVGVPELKDVADSDDKKTRWVELQDPDHRRPALQGRQLRRRRQHGRQDRVPEAALQDGAGRVLRREADPQGAREGARDLRHRRLHGVHRVPGLQVPRRPEPERARGARRAQGARSAQGEGRRADRRRDDADAGRAAVLRQPHHLHRQHDDARQRHPARDAAGRRRRLQHRGAEVQRQAAESARLLQGARRASRAKSTSRRCRTRRTRSTSS